MKTLYSKHKWMQIIFGALLLAAGIAIIVVSVTKPDTVTEWLSVILAIGTFIFGATLIFSAIFGLNDHYFDIALLFAALFIAIGVVLCVQRTLIGDVIIYFVGALLITFGVIGLGQSVAMIFFKRRKLAIALFFIAGALILTLGVLALCFPDQTKKIVYICVGVILAVFGIIEIIFGIISTTKKNKDNKPEEVEENKVDNKENIDDKNKTEPVESANEVKNPEPAKEDNNEVVNPEVINEENK